MPTLVTNSLRQATSGPFSHLFVYWESEPNYVANGPKLENDLSLSAPESRGFLADVQVPKDKWWKRLSLKDWIISAAAFGTALTLLRVDLAALIEPPEAEIAFVDLTPIDATINAPLSVQATILNSSSYATTNVRNIGGVIRSESRTEVGALSSDQTILSNLTAGQSAKLTLSGFAPTQAISNGPPAVYSLAVSVSARTGILPQWKQVSVASERKVLLWPSDLGWGSSQIVRGGGQNGKPEDIAQMSVFLFPGRTYQNGVSGNLIVVSRPDEISKLSIGGQDGAEFESSRSSAVTHEVFFHTPALEKFKPYPLMIVLQAQKALPQSRWGELLRSIQIHVESQGGI